MGTDHGKMLHEKVIKRKVDAVVNGIVGIDDFFPDHDAEKQEVTVVMLSHIVTVSLSLLSFGLEI
jgi:hypothetical protein